MTFHEFFAFILPEFDVIQMLFGGTMLFLVLLTIGLLLWQANQRFWDRKWQGDALNNGADHLDVEHGSVNEISAAVASPAEKMADIMPGILLILGLLGTFLGLGIALNKASDILIDANSAGMDNAMSNLMGMMEGLGTKFKTSTWGIMAYLILKACAAGLGYDEKRLRWCAQQMKQVFDQSREQKRAEHEETLLQYLAALQGLNDRMQVESEATRQSLSKLSSGMESFLQTLIDQGKTAAQQSKLLETNLVQLADVSRSNQQQLMKGLQDASSRICHESEISRRENHSLFTEVIAACTKISKQGDNAEQQRATQNAQLMETHKLLQGIQKDRVTDGKALLAQGQQQVTELATTRKSLQHFIDTNSSNLSAIQYSAEKMSSAAQEMGDSAGDLQQVIGDFRTGITDMLGTVKTDLGSTIAQMGESFSENMESISASMANATDGISTAVTDLSQNVGSTMSEVRISIDQSMKTQREAQREFMITSETLNEKVIAMTRLVDDLREQIVNGLTAVSSSNRQVASLNNRYTEMTTSGERNADAIEALVNQLQLMQKESPLQPGMDIITADVGKLVRSIESLRDEMLSNANELPTTLSSLDDRLFRSLTELEEIRTTLSSPERNLFVQQIEKSLTPLTVTLQHIDQTLSAMNIVNDAA
ncbi:hypothetical protein LL067_15645 [Yersinia pseudotuberculosis]|uniref:hypothetical protein n=1 Tax=Yersinia TaxID=629 RepID=UPI0011A7F38D|nr:hypothetical protein [Yersinia aleksiciae]EKN4007413.1 hypothetical protein [Yersinia enterocolitica]